MRCDIVVIGAGIVGLATADALMARRRDLSVVVVDKEPRIAAHQSGRNSGVIHSGIYYTPGSNKASMARAGRSALLDFCAEHDIAHDLCGKVIVATGGREHERLLILAERADANGVRANLIGPAELRDLEPNVVGVAALHVPDAGLVDFLGVAERLVQRIVDRGGRVVLGRPVIGLAETSSGVRVDTGADPIEAAALVNCAGLFSDRIARLAGADPVERIMPFRGEYFDVVPHRRDLVRTPVYPVPDPAFPFLGAHFTPSIDGGLHVGPNAVPAFAREGYGWGRVDSADLREIVVAPSSWRLARKYWRTGVGEIWRSLNRRALVTALRKLVPRTEADDLEPAPSGVRAQAIAPDGRLLDDFVFRDTTRAVHVVNAPSPAATASLAIGETIAGRTLTKI